MGQPFLVSVSWITGDPDGTRSEARIRANPEGALRDVIGKVNELDMEDVRKQIAEHKEKDEAKAV